MSVHNINIHRFLRKFGEAYEFLYDNYDNVPGYQEAVSWGDEFIRTHHDFVMEFNKFRGDILSSEREVAAFAYVLMDEANRSDD